MPIKNIYVPDNELPLWEEAVQMAKDHHTSLSKLVVGELKRILRERKKGTGVPLGVPVPASMKDPKLVAAEQTADRVRAIVLEALMEEES